MKWYNHVELYTPLQIPSPVTQLLCSQAIDTISLAYLVYKLTFKTVLFPSKKKKTVLCVNLSFASLLAIIHIPV